jgi:hypothetical protein
VPSMTIEIHDRMNAVPEASHEVLYAKGTSRCCNSKMRLVQSRPGGFVSRDCEGCGKSYWVRWSQLPELVCGFCGHPLAVRMLDGKNYYYACEHCSKAWKLASILPHWSEYFAYSGLAAHGDGPFV